ncbi:hypothetical protein LCGC14_1461740 [marine sediment metagenome]|uniref:Uncharacterized protein n=1 Tax=marine sediment metagenome TaxID=412755 RepID=A0A0F9K0Z8_9ZZZZ
MNNKTKKLTVAFICVFLILGIFAQTNNLASSLTAAAETGDSPSLSNYNEIYDLGGGNSMNILSDDTANNTITTLDTGTDSLPIDSTFTEGSTGSSKAVINNSVEISTTTNNKTILKDRVTGFNVTVDNGFNPHSVENIEAYGIEGYSNVSVSATANMTEGFMQHFEVWEDGATPWVVIYDWDYATDVTCLTVTYLTTLFYIYQAWDWIAIDLGPAIYNISTITGQISVNGIPTGFDVGSGLIHDIVPGISLVTFNDTIIITDGVFETILVWTVFGFDVAIYHLFLPLIILWPSLWVSISIFWGYWSYIFYLWILYELLFIITYPDYDYKIEYYYTYIVIVWIYLQITIWYSYYYIHWVVIFWWNWWIIKIQWWFITINFVWIFIDFIIWIEYYYLSWHWIYIFYVPTPVLPNILQIDIVKTLFTNTTFDITILVKDYWDNPISGATVYGTWNGLSIGTVTDNGDGTYDFTLSAILVSPLQPGKWLNLTGSKMGYADASHDTEIAVDPDTVNKPPTPSIDEDTLIPGPSILIIGVVSSFAIVGVVKYLKKKRKIIKP